MSAVHTLFTDAMERTSLFVQVIDDVVYRLGDEFGTADMHSDVVGIEDSEDSRDAVERREVLAVDIVMFVIGHNMLHHYDELKCLCLSCVDTFSRGHNVYVFLGLVDNAVLEDIVA